ncbi:serine carboxypeptidase-like 11 [Andrographis paniculata]|uniref:serine carboxypeptidase-like 11 n=1 Tax=Andrographis paniculata TaxID=175694 RepID=UPI0021E7282D|nr:serine carboxypeptidase-like 11 [Andrographis paniculata]
MKHSHHLSIIFFLVFLLAFRCQFVDGGASQVKFLPGFEGPLPIHLETGYIGVGEEEKVQLFYFFVKSNSNPEKDPIVLWLIGGPGCSSLSSLLFEIGPLLIDRENDESLPTLSMHPHAFTEAANIIYLDLPVGTGYSYARTPEALRSTGLQSCEHAHQFVQKWLIDHPEFASNPFYVGGNSYVGITVPVIVDFISNGNEATIDPRVNLKGYVLGNPGTTFPADGDYRIPFAHGMGLIPDELYESLKENCNGSYINVDSNNLACLKDVQKFHQLVDVLFEEQILETTCDPRPRPSMEIDERTLDSSNNHQQFARNWCYSLMQTCKANYTGKDSFECSRNFRTLHQLVEDFLKQVFESSCQKLRMKGDSASNGHQELDEIRQLPPMKSCYNYRLNFIDHWASDPHVQEALHVRKGTVEEFIRCNHSIPHTDILWDSTPYHANLSAKGYRSLIYSGDHDMVVPFISTQAWIRSLNYSIVDEWRPWFVEGVVAGYTRSYANNMTFATVKGGSHTPGSSHPKECAAMFKRWMSYKPL